MEKWRIIILSVRLLWLHLSALVLVRVLTSTGWVGSSGCHWNPECSTSQLCQGMGRIDLMMLNLSLSPLREQWIGFWNCNKIYRAVIKYMKGEAHVFRYFVLISSTIHEISGAERSPVNIYGSNHRWLWESQEDLSLRFLLPLLISNSVSHVETVSAFWHTSQLPPSHLLWSGNSRICQNVRTTSTYDMTESQKLKLCKGRYTICNV